METNKQIKKYRIAVIALSIFLVFVIAFFVYGIRQIGSDYQFFVDKVIDDVIYRKNAAGSYDVVGIVNPTNEEHEDVVIVEAIKGLPVTHIRENSFVDAHIGKITIPASIKSIGSQAFMDALITELVLTEGLETIGEYAFRGCTYLVEVEFPSTLASLDYGAFFGCFSLQRVTGGAGLTEVNELAFAHCSNLAFVSLDGPVTIGYGCFRYAASAFIVELRNAKRIGTHCFYHSFVQSMYLSPTLGELEQEALSGAPLLTDIHYAGTVDQWLMIEGIDQVSDAITMHFESASNTWPEAE